MNGGIEIMAVAERQIKWIPKGWDWRSKKLAIIRDGKITQLDRLEGYFVEADPDGAIEFLQTIKRAVAETRE